MFIRSFAPGWERPSPDMQRSWDTEPMNLLSPIGDRARVCRYIFDRPSQAIGALTLSEQLDLDPFFVSAICKELVVLDFLEETPPLSRFFRVSPNFGHEPSLKFTRNLGYSDEEIRVIIGNRKKEC